VPGGVISPASFLQPNLPPQSGLNVTTSDSLNNAVVSIQGSGDKHLAGDHTGIRRQHDKSEHIQFLQNVHFPERHRSQAVTQGVVCPNKNVFTMHDKAALRSELTSNLEVLISCT